MPLWLALDVAAGALLTSAWQARGLRPRAGAAYRWVGASLAGWLLATGVVALAGTRAAYRLGVGGVLFNTGVILFDGVVLGAVKAGRKPQARGMPGGGYSAIGVRAASRSCTAAASSGSSTGLAISRRIPAARSVSSGRSSM